MEAVTLERALADIAAAQNYNDWLFARARPYLGERVLDAGAGLGTFSELVAGAGASVVALEHEPPFVEHLRCRFAGRPEVTVVEGVAEALPDAVPGGLDSVLCLNVLEHVPEDDAALRGFRDRLRDGGRLLLLVPAHPVLYGAYDRAAGHVRRYGGGELRQKLVDAGFELERVHHVNPIGALGWLVRVRLARHGDWPSTSFHTFDRLVPLLRRLDPVPLPVGLSLWAVARRR